MSSSNNAPPQRGVGSEYLSFAVLVFDDDNDDGGGCGGGEDDNGGDDDDDDGSENGGDGEDTMAVVGSGRVDRGGSGSINVQSWPEAARPSADSLFVRIRACAGVISLYSADNGDDDDDNGIGGDRGDN